MGGGDGIHPLSVRWATPRGNHYSCLLCHCIPLSLLAPRTKPAGFIHWAGRQLGHAAQVGPTGARLGFWARFVFGGRSREWVKGNRKLQGGGRGEMPLPWQLWRARAGVCVGEWMSRQLKWLPPSHLLARTKPASFFGWVAVVALPGRLPTSQEDCIKSGHFLKEGWGGGGVILVT